MDFERDYQTVLINLAGEVSKLIASKDKRKYFEEQVQKFIGAFDYWRNKVIEGQHAARDDPKLNIGKEPADDGSDEFEDNQIKEKWRESVLKNKPDGYEIYSANSFDRSDYVIDEIKGYYFAPKLPPNPVETLRPTTFFSILLPEYNKDSSPIKEREPANTEEDLMRKYFLLAVIHAHKGENIPLLDKDHEAVYLVWFMYQDMDDRQEYCWGAKIRNLLKTALIDVEADLNSKKQTEIEQENTADKEPALKAHSKQIETKLQNAATIITTQDINKLLGLFRQLEESCNIRPPEKKNEIWRQCLKEVQVELSEKRQTKIEDLKERRRKAAAAGGFSSSGFSGPIKTPEEEIPETTEFEVELLADIKYRQRDSKYRQVMQDVEAKRNAILKKIDHLIYTVKEPLLKFDIAKNTLLVEDWGKIKEGSVPSRDSVRKTIDALEAIKELEKRKAETGQEIKTVKDEEMPSNYIPCIEIAVIIRKRSDAIARTLKAAKYPVIKKANKNYCDPEHAAVLFPKWKKHLKRQQENE
jgi:hypothetical protein